MKVVRGLAVTPALVDASAEPMLVALAKLTAEGVPRFGVVIAQLVVRQPERGP